MTRWPLSLLTLSLIACASTPPPKELVDARETYARVSGGPASKLVPADLLTAKEALDGAEKAFEEDPNAPSTRDLSYVAQRKAEYVAAKAGMNAAEQSKVTAQQDLNRLQQLLTERGSGELVQAREQLLREQQARLSAEKTTKESMDNAARLAAAKEGSRSSNLTLNGSVQFTTGAATLLPATQEKLNQIGQALKEQEKQTLLVEGHTDSSYQEKKSDLAMRRAQAVKDYLVSRGIASERISTSSVGSSRPLADNKSVEGRANNRRVEITVR